MLHNFTVKKKKKKQRAGLTTPHFWVTESKSPHRSLLAVDVGFDGDTELELLESRSSKQPGDIKETKKWTLAPEISKFSALFYAYLHQSSTTAHL